MTNQHLGKKIGGLAASRLGKIESRCLHLAAFLWRLPDKKISGTLVAESLLVVALLSRWQVSASTMKGYERETIYGWN